MSRDEGQYAKMTPAERNEEYLQLLREKNRIKKHMSSKSKQEAVNEERERGFSTHFAGANASGTKPRKKKIVTGTGKLKIEDVTIPKADKNRRRWDTDNDGPAGMDGIQIPLGEWGKPKNSGADHRWSLGSGDNEPKEPEEGGVSGRENERADDEVSEEVDYDEYEEDFEEEDTAGSSPRSSSQAIESIVAEPLTSNNSHSSSSDVLQLHLKGKIRTEKEVIRLNSASSSRPQSSGVASFSKDIHPLNWGGQELTMPQRPVSNQSAVRSSGLSTPVSPAKIGSSSNASMSLKPTPGEAPRKAKSPKKSTPRQRLDDVVDNPNNISAILDNSLVEKVSDLDERQREKLLSLLIGSSRGRADIAEGGTDQNEDFNLTQSQLKQSAGTTVFPVSLSSTVSEMVTPRTLNLSQLDTIPVLKQDPPPGSKAIDSADRANQISSAVIDSEMSMSGMSAMFKAVDEVCGPGAGGALSEKFSGQSAKLNTVQELTENSPQLDSVPITVNFRIRIHNSWVEEKSKKRFVSLRHVGLRLAGSLAEIDTTSLDISLYCGLSALSKSSESVSTLRRLFAIRSRLSNGPADEWRGPYDTGNPLEIRISGTLQVSSQFCEEALRVSGSDVLLDGSMPSDVLELVISNGLNLPARDADVYNGQKCVWSGCFDQLLNIGNDLVRPDPKLIEASLLIVPLRQKQRGSTNKPRAESSSLGGSTSEINVDKNDQSVPTWLKAKSGAAGASAITQHVATIDADENEALRRSVQSKRKTSDLKFGAPVEDLAMAAPIDVLGPMPRLGSAKPKSSHSYARRQKKKEDDDALRQSLDALEHSNRLNRGRLGGRRRPLGQEAPETPTEQTTRATGEIVITKRDAESKEKLALNQLVSEKGEVSKLAAGISNFEDVANIPNSKPNQPAQDRRLQKRSEKIDQVQETVRSALANLADVMSNMNIPSRAGGSDNSSPDVNCTSRIRVSPRTLLGEDKITDNNFLGTNQASSSLPSTAVACPSDFGDDSLGLDDDNLDVIGADGDINVVDPCVNHLEGSIGEIPILPNGKNLRLEILSTWGDHFYVGLNGIDIFDGEGHILKYSEMSHPKNAVKGVQYSNVTIDSIAGNPSDINVLDEYENDPRHVSNLIGPNNFTRDDMHVWLAPCGEMAYESEYDSSDGVVSKKVNSSGKPITYALDAAGNRHAIIATITMSFSSNLAVSMIRIWNYNKSRTHCMRGVRRARLLLDTIVIFDGEIRIAQGTLDSAETCSEVILFSTDMAILANVAEYDRIAGYQGETKSVSVDEAAQKWIDSMNHKKNLQRPRTADTTLVSSDEDLLSSMNYRDHPTARPTTAATGSRTVKLRDSTDFMNSLQNELNLVDSIDAKSIQNSVDFKRLRETDLNSQGLATSNGIDAGTKLSDEDLVYARVLSLTIESTWGDRSYTGLSGLEVLTGCESIVARIDNDMIDADPRDLSVIGCFDDVRTPDKLVNGINETTDDSNFWLIPFSKGSTHRISIDLGAACKIAGLRIWNYNKTPEDALRGVRVASVYVDGRFIGQFVARIAPGCDGINFGQTVYFKNLKKFMRSPSAYMAKGPSATVSYITPAVRQSYETPNFPCGMHWKFSIFSNWGDSYYVGLDAIEFLDEFGELIPIQPVLSRGDGKVLANTSLSNTLTKTTMNQDDWIPALITAVPYSVQDVISAGSNSHDLEDQRVPCNLFNGKNRDASGHNSWLAPIAHCMEPHERAHRGRRVLHSQQGWNNNREDHTQEEFSFFDENVLFVLFDYPVTISAIRIYNYSKNPSRGVRDFSIEVDGRILYMGVIEAALDDAKNSMKLPDAKNTLGPCTVLFTNDPKIVKYEREKVQYCGTIDQDVLHIDERKVMVRSKGMFDKPSPTTEGVVTDVQKRPLTSMTREK